MKYRVVHRTEYSYPQPVLLAHNETHLTPRSSGRQSVLYHQLEVDPSPNMVSERQDFFGNAVTYFSLETAHSHLRVTATTELDIQRGTGQLHIQSSAPWEETAARVREGRTNTTLDARQYLLDSPLAPVFPELEAYAAKSFPPGRLVVEAVHDLMQRIHADFTFDPGFTTVATPLTDVFEHRAASVRTSRTSPSPVCAPDDNPRAMSQGTSRPLLRRVRKGLSAPMPPTLGSRSTTPTWAGWTSTPPIIRSPWTSTSPQPGAAITPTSPRSKAWSSAAVTTIRRYLSM